MGKFHSYGEKVNEIATAAFNKYRKAEKAYRAAEDQRNKYPQRMGMVDAEYAAKSARAQADYLEAKEAFSKAKITMQNHNIEIAALRKELAAELAAYYAADPAELDHNTLELMKSGILAPHEYAKLMREAASGGNHTMARLIAKYAADAAEARAGKYGQDDDKAITLRTISYTAGQHDGSETLQAFDAMADVYNRAINNPYMIDHWEELTGPIADSI